MTRPARRPSSGRWPLLTLLTIFACGREPPREAPPQNGKPARPAATESAPRGEQESTAPAPVEKDQAAPAPAASEPAPAPPPTSAKPAAKRRAPAKGKAQRSEDDNPDWDFGLAPSDRTRALRQQLDDAVKLSTPDCPSARERKQAICDLAQQICQMVDRDPDVASVESYCGDAKQRCSDAEKRTAQRCQ